jgi:dTDP-4-amino-4,6-dideoxygalactose transaminase
MASTIGREMILMNNFRSEPAELRQQTVSAIAEVIESGSFILGHQVEEFERLWAMAWTQLKLACEQLISDLMTR